MRLLVSSCAALALLVSSVLATPLYHDQTTLMSKIPLKLQPGLFKLPPADAPRETTLAIKVKPQADANVEKVSETHAQLACFCATGTICCNSLEGVRCNYGLCGV